VGGQIAQSLVCTPLRLFGDEPRSQRTIAVLSFDIVDAVLSRDDFTCQEPRTMRGLANPSQNNRSVLVAITGEQVRPQPSVQRLGEPNRPRAVYCSAIHFSTFATFIAAVSLLGFQWFDRREIWVAGRPRHWRC
jgi:hypothetical protein